MFDDKDKEIFFAFELLQTFYDLYIYKQKNNTLNYQSIMNLVKHRNFEIIKLDVKEDNSMSSNRFISIGSNNNISNNDKINIYLKMDLKEKEERKNEINISMEKIIFRLYKSKFKIQKILKLKNGDLAFANEAFFITLKNLELFTKIDLKKCITDFIELDNQNICVLMEENTFLVILFRKNNILEKGKTINLLQDKIYYNLKNIINSNIAILSYIYNKKTYMNLLLYPNYNVKEIPLLDDDYKGDLIQLDDNNIIICFVLLEFLCVYFYDITNDYLEKINIKSYQTYKKCVKCFKIMENKLLLSTIHTGIIFNYKTKQAETFVQEFKNIQSINKIGEYILVGLNNIIGQINFKSNKIENKFKMKNSKGNIKYIIDLGNNKFCALFFGDIYLFNYN